MRILCKHLEVGDTITTEDLQKANTYYFIRNIEEIFFPNSQITLVVTFEKRNKFTNELIDRCSLEYDIDASIPKTWIIISIEDLPITEVKLVFEPKC